LLIQRAAILSVMIEDCEMRFSLGKPFEVADFLQMTNSLRRILATVGALERRSRDVSPTLSDYLRAARETAVDTEVESTATDGLAQAAAEDMVSDEGRQQRGDV
jgi:hypothetical protein